MKMVAVDHAFDGIVLRGLCCETLDFTVASSSCTNAMVSALKADLQDKRKYEKGHAA